jgi:hypothetical protein
MLVGEISMFLSGWWCNVPILKDGVRQWEVLIIPYMKWKITFMFETTKQLWFYGFHHHRPGVFLPLTTSRFSTASGAFQSAEGPCFRAARESAP